MVQFWRQNGLMIAAIALPLLVALAVLTAKEVERAKIPPPQHAVLFRVGGGVDLGEGVDPCYGLKVADGRLQLTYMAPPQEQQKTFLSDGYCERYAGRLFLFDPKTRQVREIALPIPEEDPKADARWPVAGGLEGLRLSAKRQSPDGYTFSTGSKSGSLMTEMFGGAHRRFAQLTKEGRTEPVPMSKTGVVKDAYASIVFLAWVVGEEGE